MPFPRHSHNNNRDYYDDNEGQESMIWHFKLAHNQQPIGKKIILGIRLIVFHAKKL